MSDLTKQYFDKQLGKLATKEEVAKLATKEEIAKLATKEEIAKQTKEIKSYVDDRIFSVEEKLETKIETEVADLVGIVSRRFDDLEKKFDLNEEVDKLKFQMKKVWEALNIVSK